MINRRSQILSSITFIIFSFSKFLSFKRKDPSSNVTIFFIFPPLVHIRSRTKRCSKISPQQHFREEIFFVSGNRIFEHSLSCFLLCVLRIYTQNDIQCQQSFFSLLPRTERSKGWSTRRCVLRVKRLVDNDRFPRRDS